MPSVNQAPSLTVSGTLSVSQDYEVVDFLDAVVLDASIVNIPASAAAPLQIVASLAADVRAMQFQDTTGATLGVYTDAGGTTLKFLINPGSDSILFDKIPAGTTLYVKNMDNVTVTVGTLAINFLG